MLLFATILDIEDTLSEEDFIRMAIACNQDSTYPDNVIPDLQWNGERSIRFGDDRKWMEILQYRNRNIIAIRYEKQGSDGAVWDTDYIMNFSEMRMAVLLYRSYREEALNIDADFSSPHFIRYLTRGRFIKDDGDFPVLGEPIPVLDTELYRLVQVIGNQTEHRLPVVYVSKTYCNKDPVDVQRLAGRLKGVAHVLVQENTRSNKVLKAVCSGGSPHNGAIGIWYPGGKLSPQRLLYHGDGEAADEQLYQRVIRNVIHYSNVRQLDDLYTWQGVSNALLNDRLESKRAETLAAQAAQRRAEIETDDVYAAFDEELREYQRQVEQLRNDNAALRAENHGLHRKLSQSDEIPLLSYGDEDDLYPGEIREIVLETLGRAINPNNNRRADILRDLCEKNKSGGTNAEKREQIRKMLGSYDGMNNVLRQKLKDFGFEITEEGKHYKLTFCDDNRYAATLAKTPSDYREGKNSASEIIGKML